MKRNIPPPNCAQWVEYYLLTIRADWCLGHENRQDVALPMQSIS